MITNNIKEDIENAEEWFKKNLEILPLDKIAKQEEGVVSYSLWEAEHKSSNLIVLIHGTGAHKKWWYPIAPSLRKNSNVIALDLPGMGDSDHRESYTMSNFGDAITDIIEKEKANGLSEEVFLKAKREFLNRYEKINFHKYYLENPFKESCLALYNWAPIADELKILDKEIVLNSMRLKWNLKIDEFKKLTKNLNFN